MIPRYTLPEMGKIWEEENKLRCWLRVELAAVEVMANLEIIPKKDAAVIKAKAGFDVERASVRGRRLVPE